jgi:hypothetical protein
MELQSDSIGSTTNRIGKRETIAKPIVNELRYLYEVAVRLNI